MGLASAALMAGFGVLLISGNYMLVSEWTFRVVNGTTSLPTAATGLAAALGAGGVAWVVWKLRTSLRPSVGST
jgi:hypothetical protein